MPRTGRTRHKDNSCTTDRVHAGRVSLRDQQRCAVQVGLHDSAAAGAAVADSAEAPERGMLAPLDTMYHARALLTARWVMPVPA